MSSTWFITGASSGIGFEVTRQLLDRGDRVAATARNLQSLESLAKDHADRLWLSQLDVTDPAAIRRVVDAAFDDLGRIDVVFSNAGSGLLGTAEEVSDEQITRLVTTNLLGSIRVARACLAHLRAQGGGQIIQLSSGAGQAPVPNFSVYCATKWGVEGFLDTLAAEVAPFGIQITIVEPGVVLTEFSQKMEVAPVLDVYANTPTAEVRRALLDGGFGVASDVAKVTAAIIAVSEQEQAPRRLALGSDSYSTMHQAIRARLAELESQEQLAASTNVDQVTPAN